MTLVDDVKNGDRRALGRLVSAVEDDTATGRETLAAVYRDGGAAWITGITGAPGAGKSTLVDLLVEQARRSGPVAVVAVDPSSAFTGGAMLGDRVRMQRHTDDAGVYIRSMANRGHLGGIAAATPRVVALLDGLGYSEILIETVGVGQAEVEVASSADTVVVVVNPGWGDAIQAAKAGLLEIGDVFVVNKADRQGAEQAVNELIGALELGRARPWFPPVIETVATDGAGLAELWDAIGAHRRHLDESGEREQRSVVRVHAEVEAALTARLRHTATSALPPEILDRVLARRVDPWSAASEMVANGPFETS
ncbi:MAG: methylmalonyl Co-A mutase-associated GTPase MeaB [Acidimicrobiia bacterium]|nr:MAG: methylmalonyl Co-A mutase-associated GTPase MeaB [Acidimicrobiia bacterium]